MDRDDAKEARMLLEYDPNCAGGLLIDEFLVYRTHQTIRAVLDDLQINRAKYIDYHVQYFYVADENEKLVGVLRRHDMLFPTRTTRLDQIMLSSPLAVSDMSGCSGNQAVAVSMRELSLGLVRPAELFRVLAREANVGIVNGIVLGLRLGGVAFLWKGNPWLGIAGGGALAANTMVSVTLGGCSPWCSKSCDLIRPWSPVHCSRQSPICAVSFSP